MKFKVNFTSDAEYDLFEIYKYVYLNDSEGSAEELFKKLYRKCLALEKYPGRGHVPSELKLLQIEEFLEIIYKPYRIIYQVKNKEVFVHCILDGRRDIQKLLQERLLRDQ
jgi:toxin ParE1/3/4